MNQAFICICYKGNSCNVPDEDMKYIYELKYSKFNVLNSEEEILMNVVPLLVFQGFFKSDTCLKFICDCDNMCRCGLIEFQDSV